MIEHVAWAVQPHSKTNNRAAMLVSELQEIGVVARDCSFSHHGTTPSSNSSKRASRIVPRISTKTSSTAVLSPVFSGLDLQCEKLKWFDAYDDWSVAPDINPIYRQYARMNYLKVRRAVNSQSLLTANSEYMAWKMGLPGTAIVANGVDSALASVESSGDSRLRIVMLGHFFVGRTDFSMIEQIASLDGVDEIVVAGLRSNKTSADRIRKIMLSSRAELVEYDWLSLSQVGQLSGSHTVGVIPHVVSDYTVSQNLMKAFQFISLGLPVVCPLLLLPPQIDIRFTYLVGPGASLETTLVPWIRSVERPDATYRQEFVRKNSWRARAEQIAERL